MTIKENGGSHGFTHVDDGTPEAIDIVAIDFDDAVEAARGQLVAAKARIRELEKDLAEVRLVHHQSNLARASQGSLASIDVITFACRVHDALGLTAVKAKPTTIAEAEQTIEACKRLAFSLGTASLIAAVKP